MQVGVADLLLDVVLLVGAGDGSLRGSG